MNRRGLARGSIKEEALEGSDIVCMGEEDSWGNQREDVGKDGMGRMTEEN